MNGKDLLTALGYIGTEFYEEAADTAQMPTRRKLPRQTLIAAILALMILLMGCAWVVMNLENQTIGEHSYTEPRYIDEEGNKIPETEKVMAVISLQGIAGSPEQMAAREWLEFERSYDPDMKLMDEADKNRIEISRDYDAYFVYTQEMVDKVDEIAAKYGLKLAGQFAGTNHWDTEIFFDSLGLSNLHREESGVAADYSSGYFYACGNFKNEFYITLPREASDWEHQILVAMRYCTKGYLDTVFAYLHEDKEYEERIYTHPDGEALLLVTGNDFAMILCDTENAFITVSFGTTYLDDGEVMHSMSDRDIELVAEAIDFSVVPQKPDMEEAQKRLDESFARWEAEQEALMEAYDDPFAPQASYAAKIQKVIANGADPDNYYYALYDVNGDGMEDLILSCEQESFGPIYTMYNGETYSLLSFGMDCNSHLCENGVILFRDPHMNPNLHTFYSVGAVTGDESEAKIIDEIAYCKWDESWVRNIYGDTWDQVLISEEEAMEIIESYGRVKLELKPISEFPMNK